MNFSLEKPAPAERPIHELLRRRWSPIAFSDEPVEPEKLASLLEAARWAPSAFNGQPWYFLVATRDNPSEFERLLACLFEKNQEWAHHSPVLMISVAALSFVQNGRPNRHAFHDVGQAVAYATIQAMSLGLWVHQMAGIDLRKIRDTYELPEGYDPVAAIALGYATTSEHLPESLRHRHDSPRSRKPVASFVFSGRWGKSFEFPVTEADPCNTIGAEGTF